MEKRYENQLDNDAITTPFQLTVFCTESLPLNKTITLEGGKLKKVANGQFSDGVVGVIDCEGLKGFKDLLDKGETNMALAMGQPHRGGEWLTEAQINIQKNLSNNSDATTIARTKDFFAFREQVAGLLLLDIDGVAGSLEEILEQLHFVDPALKSAGCVIVHSSSSCIKSASTGEMLSGNGGYHIYFLVKNAADIPRYGEVFANRSWLKGLGRIEVSKAGSYLVRQIIDSAVFSPERLIFEAPPTLGEGLMQDRPSIELRSGAILDTEKLQNLNPVEKSKILLKVNDAKREAMPVAINQQELWIESKSADLAEQTGCDLTTARAAAQRLLATDQLPDSYTLKFDKEGWVKVEELLANPEKYDHQTLADPVEVDYNGGRNVAIFYWNDGNPRIHSHAHGGKVYKFAQMQTDEEIFRRAVEDAKSDSGAHWNSEVMFAAGNVFKNNRAEYQRLRSMLKANCKDADLIKWEKSVHEKDDDGPKDPAAVLVNMVNVVSTTFRDKKNNGYVTIDMDTHKETWELGSSGFNRWLDYFAYRHLESVPSDSILKSVVTALQGKAKHEGEENEVYLRCAPYLDGYLIDMTNDLWQVIHVTPRGWEILDESPVKFVRSHTAIAIPAPAKNGDIDELWVHLNIPEECRTLVLAFMLDSFRPDTDFPILELTGAHGTAKSSTHSRIRQLTDPNSVPLRSAPQDVQDIFVSAGANWQASYENMSYLTNEMQDGLCTLATGGGMATRKLYTNSEEIVLDVKRPCIINGISAVATRPDLIDRIIHLDLPPLESYISKRELDQRFEQALPKLFAALLDIFSRTLKQLPHVKIDDLPRMGDFALLGQALHFALHDERAFVDVYRANRSDSLQSSLEACPVAMAIWKYAEELGHEWNGTVMELKDILERRPHDHDGWPKSPKGLGNILRRMGPALAEVGVSMKTVRKKDGFNVTITYFSGEEKFADQRSPRSPMDELVRYN